MSNWEIFTDNVDCRYRPALVVTGNKNLRAYRKREIGNLHRAMENHMQGAVNIRYAIKYANMAMQGDIDEFTYNLIMRRCFSPDITFAVDGAFEAQPMSASNQEYLTEKDKALLTEIPDKKNVRVLSIGRIRRHLQVTGYATYEEWKSGSLYINVAMEDIILRSPKDAVFLGGNILESFNRLARNLGGENFAANLDMDRIMDALEGRRIVCSEDDRTLLTNLSPRFADLCEVRDVPEEVLNTYASNALVNDYTGSSLDTGGVSEGFQGRNRLIFLLTVGYDLDVASKGMFSKLRRGASEADYSLVQGRKIAYKDLGKIDFYASSTFSNSGVEETLIMTSAGILRTVSDQPKESTGVDVIAYSDVAEWLRKNYLITEEAVSKRSSFDIFSYAWKFRDKCSSQTWVKSQCGLAETTTLNAVSLGRHYLEYLGKNNGGISAEESNTLKVLGTKGALNQIAALWLKAMYCGRSYAVLDRLLTPQDPKPLFDRLCYYTTNASDALVNRARFRELELQEEDAKIWGLIECLAYLEAFHSVNPFELCEDKAAWVKRLSSDEQ